MGLFKKKEPDRIDVIIENLEADLAVCDPLDESYDIIFQKIEKLKEYKNPKGEKKDYSRILSTGIIVGGAFLQMAVAMWWENRGHTMPREFMNFGTKLPKP